MLPGNAQVTNPRVVSISSTWCVDTPKSPSRRSQAVEYFLRNLDDDHYGLHYGAYRDFLQLWSYLVYMRLGPLGPSEGSSGPQMADLIWHIVEFLKNLHRIEELLEKLH